MKKSRKIIMVCIVIATGYMTFASASPREHIEQESPLRLVEHVQALDAVPVMNTYVTPDDENDVEEPLTVYRTIDNLRLRSEPSAEAEIIETVPQGTLLVVTDTRDGDWYSVQINGAHGYMSSDFLAFVAVRPPGAPMYMAGSVTVMDADTGYVLYEDAQHTLRYPASVTKIMTALLVLENIEDLSEPVTFSDNSVALPGYAFHMSIQAGDTLPVIDALYALMLTSSNEAARALAEHVFGSVEDFVYEMNRRAYSLGAVNTHFVNPCGLPGENQYTTSYDMALIMREAVRHPVYYQIIATPRAYLPPIESRDSYRPMRNTNRMIHYDDPDFNEWIVGGKTGFTNDAQHTLITYSEIDGRSIIISVLYVPQRGVIFSDTNALLEYISKELNNTE
ncbi:MAG: serine hydrolase [Defluviitaleaceae bacterium]|nr:serine hydrolase [Defluviitaleaceae bacterium]